MSAYLAIVAALGIVAGFAIYGALDRMAHALGRIAECAEREERRRAAFDSLLEPEARR